MADRPFFFRQWRERTPRERVLLALILATGVAAAVALPDWAWHVFAVTLMVISYLTVWRWNRRREQAQPPGRSWTPPLRDPGSES